MGSAVALIGEVRPKRVLTLCQAIKLVTEGVCTRVRFPDGSVVYAKNGHTYVKKEPASASSV